MKKDRLGREGKSKPKQLVLVHFVSTATPKEQSELHICSERPANSVTVLSSCRLTDPRSRLLVISARCVTESGAYSGKQRLL